jgi:hypothetical protein
LVFKEPIAIPADSDSSSDSEENAVADPMEFASPPTLALPPPAEVTPTPAPLPEEKKAGESAGPASGSPSDSPPLREQLAKLLRLDMDQLLSPYNTRKIQTVAAILLSDSSLPAFERSVLECIKKLPAEVLYYRQLLRDKEAFMETLKKEAREAEDSYCQCSTSAVVSGFSRDMEEQRKEIADKEAQIARLREERAMAQLSIEHMEREGAQADEALDKTVAEAGRKSGKDWSIYQTMKEKN